MRFIQESINGRNMIGKSFLTFIWCWLIIATVPISAQIRTAPTPEARLQSRGQILAAIADSMVFIQGGTFIMGCLKKRDKNCTKYAKPSHSVTIDDFHLSRTEVTQAQWRVIMGNDPPKLKFKNCDNCPVEGVDFYEVDDFIRKLNGLTGKKYRLPTEAEWEYAARGGSKSKGYGYAGSHDLEEVAWYSGNSGGRTQPVAQKKKNELGLYDMSGNVLEWCRDYWHYLYSSEDQKNPTGPKKGDYRVLRSGSWAYGSKVCAVAFRSSYLPRSCAFDLGFRLAL
jgi:sulfatase modifying factor 1